MHISFKFENEISHIWYRLYPKRTFDTSIHLKKKKKNTRNPTVRRIHNDIPLLLENTEGTDLCG